MAHINQLLKFCGTPENIFFCQTDKKVIILIHSHWTATVVLAVVIFLFANQRERGQCPRLNRGITCFKNSDGTLTTNPWSSRQAVNPQPLGHIEVS